MTELIFLSTLILSCIQWLNAHQYYPQFAPEYKRPHHGNFLRPSTPTSTEASLSSEGPKNYNKNVNVVLNIDSEEVAQRLWKIIQQNLNQNPSGQSSMYTQQQLQKVIMPLVSSTRRGFTAVPITEIGEKLEKITRKALIIDDPERSPVDREILMRNIVSNMMLTLKTVILYRKELSENAPSRRMIIIPKKYLQNSERNNRYATLAVKIRRADILRIINSML